VRPLLSHQGFSYATHRGQAPRCSYLVSARSSRHLRSIVYANESYIRTWRLASFRIYTASKSNFPTQVDVRLFFFLQFLTPASTAFLVTPSLTNCITTPSVSTFLLRLSSSKNSISLYSIPVSRCILSKCVVLVPGYICRLSKQSIARWDDESALGILRSWSISRPSSGAEVRDATPILMLFCLS
jgi:hypothetical protein